MVVVVRVSGPQRPNTHASDTEDQTWILTVLLRDLEGSGSNLVTKGLYVLDCCVRESSFLQRQSLLVGVSIPTHFGVSIPAHFSISIPALFGFFFVSDTQKKVEEDIIFENNILWVIAVTIPCNVIIISRSSFPLIAWFRDASRI